MYMIRKNIRLILLVLFVLIILWFIYYAATHGRAKVINSGDSMIQLMDIDDNSKRYEVKNGGIVPSGNYALRNNNNNSQRVAYVSVPRWLRETTVSFGKNPSAQTERIASLTYENFFPADNGSLVSFSDIKNYTTGYTIHPSDDAFGGRYTDVILEEEFISPIATDSGHLVGLSDGFLSRYSFASQSKTVLSDASIREPSGPNYGKDVTLKPKLLRAKDIDSAIIGVFTKTDNTLRILDEDNSITKQSVSIKNSRSIVFDVNNKGWVFVETVGNLTEAKSEEDEARTLDYKLLIYSNDEKKVVELPIGDAQVVSEVALSPSGKFVALLKDGKLWVYDISGKREVFVNPFTLSNRLFWSKDKLYSLSNESGISVLSMSNMQLLAMDVRASDSFSYTDMTPIGSKLYFTAFTPNEEAKLPDGYVMDLEKPKNTITDELAKDLPYEGGTYDISYLKNTIYVRINVLARSPADDSRIEKVKAEATKKIQELVNKETLDKVQIVFI